MASELPLAELAHGPQTVKDGRLVCTRHWPSRRCKGHRSASSGSVEQISEGW